MAAEVSHELCPASEGTVALPERAQASMNGATAVVST